MPSRENTFLTVTLPVENFKATRIPEDRALIRVGGYVVRYIAARRLYFALVGHTRKATGGVDS